MDAQTNKWTMDKRSGGYNAMLYAGILGGIDVYELF